MTRMIGMTMGYDRVIDGEPWVEIKPPRNAINALFCESDQFQLLAIRFMSCL